MSIDPGDAKAAGRICYGAIFVDGELQRCLPLNRDLARDWLYAGGTSPDVVVIEKPQMDGRSRKIPPKVLINLAWAGALVAGELKPDKLVALTPSQWKGGINKHPHHLRIWRRLSYVEQAAVGKSRAWLRKRGGPMTGAEVYELLRAAAENYARTGKITKHAFYDVLDAVGLGLRYFNRIGGGTL